jgi:ubiquinone/menaquinone biosynthesis C-methylase UbiE
MMLTQDLFETISCPLCGKDTFDIEVGSKYPAEISADELKSVFRASSDHTLLDQVVRCRSCAMVYVNPRINSDLIISGYSDAEDPLFAAQNDNRIKAFRRTLKGVVRRLKLDPKGKRVLDVGCAGGAFLVAAREMGFDPHGVEPSRWMSDFGRRTYDLDIKAGILEAGMFPDHSFDVVTLWDVIEHLPDPHDTLTVIHRLLKPDGLLLVNYPDIESIAAKVLGKRWPFWLSVHLLYYTPATMFKQLERAGFSPLWRQAFWMTLPLGYVCERAAPYSALLRPLPRLSRLLGIHSLPLSYNMGQALVVSRIKQS